MDKIQTYKNFINQLLYGGEGMKSLHVSDFTKEEQEFVELLNDLGRYIADMQEFASILAEGNLETFTQDTNPLIAPLKSLQASLRHITWQAKQVAQGDYSQQIDFMGDFSDAFNVMVRKLKSREQEQKEKAEIEKRMAEQRERLLKEQLEQQVQHYISEMNANQKLEEFRHDTKNHYFSIDSLLEKGQVNAAREYLRQITTIVKTDQEFIHTGNVVFDALLTEKLSIAKSKKIDLEICVLVERQLRIDNFDWCSLFGNALDNALEACEKLHGKQRKIWIVIKTRGSVLQADISNTSNPPQKIKKNQYRSSKFNPEEHGLGLKIMAQAVEKYNGVLKTAYQDGIFRVSFLLCNI